VTPATVPGAPTGVSGTPANGQVTVSWSAPADDGGSSISGYTVTSLQGAKTCTTTGALTCTVTGLTNGTGYTFTVVATNDVGDGPTSDPSSTVTPGTYQSLVNPASVPTGWQASTFDDSGWTTSEGPFSNGNYCGFSAGASNFPLGATVYLRSTFFLPSGVTGLRVRGTVDNWATGYFNGSQIGTASSGGCAAGAINWSVPDASLNAGGNNVLAVVASDDGSTQAYLDLSVEYTPPPVVTETTVPDGANEAAGEPPTDP
jgi:hypothetical protein